MQGRIWLYAIAATLAAALLWFGREKALPPDFQTFEVKTKLALLGSRAPEARELVEEHRSWYGDTLKFKLLEGWLCEKEGDLEAAKEAYLAAELLCKSDEQRGVVALKICDLQVRTGDVESARSWLEKAKVSGCDAFSRREMRIRLLISDDRPDEALSEARSLADENPDSNRARALLESLEKSLVATPTTPSEDSRSGVREER